MPVCEAAKPIENGSKACAPICKKLVTPGSISYTVCVTGCQFAITYLCGTEVVAPNVTTLLAGMLHGLKIRRGELYEGPKIWGGQAVRAGAKNLGGVRPPTS